MAELLDMTGPEWFLVGLTAVLCVIGLLLPRFGNQIGKAVMGEDPAVVSWRSAWAQRRAQRRSERSAKNAARRARKAAKKAARLARKRGGDASAAATGTAASPPGASAPTSS